MEDLVQEEDALRRSLKRDYYILHISSVTLFEWRRGNRYGGVDQRRSQPESGR
jgi:hypothetical protein